MTKTILYIVLILVSCLSASAVFIAKDTQLENFTVVHNITVDAVTISTKNVTINNTLAQTITLLNGDTQSLILFINDTNSNNDMFYNQTSPEYSNRLFGNVSVNATQRVIYLSYPNSNKWIEAIPTTTSDLEYAYDSSVLTVKCTGDGFTARYLTKIGAQYTIYHDGAYVGVSSTDDYTTTTCSTWTFTLKGPKVSETSPLSDTINKSILAVLMALAIMFMTGYPVFKYHDEWDVQDWLKWMVISLIVVFFGTIVMMNIWAI